MARQQEIRPVSKLGPGDLTSERPFPPDYYLPACTTARLTRVKAVCVILHLEYVYGQLMPLSHAL